MKGCIRHVSIVLIILVLFDITHKNAFGETSEQRDDIRIDRYASTIPAIAERSVTALAEYLGKAGRTERDKARAIYRWIVDHISFDIATVQAGEKYDTLPAATLESHQTTCDGYANLFQSLAEQSGLTSRKVLGLSRGNPFSPDAIPTLHAWNLVRISGRWQCIDTAWGAGYCDGRNRFIHQPTDYYFCTPPEEFIYGHFPDDPTLQHLTPPLTREQFLDLISVSPLYFQYGIHAISHTRHSVRSGAQLSMSFTIPVDIEMTARLCQESRLLPDLAFVQQHGETVMVSAMFPHQGRYRLQLLARKKSEEGKYLGIAEYQVDASEGRHERIGYPRAFGDFSRTNAILIVPMQRYLPSDKPVDFQLVVPEAVEVLILDEVTTVSLDCEGKHLFKGQIVIHPGSIIVAARFAGNQQYKVLLEYTGVTTDQENAGNSNGTAELPDEFSGQ